MILIGDFYSIQEFNKSKHGSLFSGLSYKGVEN